MFRRLKIAIITNIITTYRKGFYDRLIKREDFHVTIYCQSSIPGTNLVSIHEQYPENIKIIKYLSAKRERIVWQFLPWKEIINDYDIIFVAGNPRVLSDVILGTYLRITGKRVILWTMAHSFRGNKFTEGIRLIWTKMFPYLFVYTDKEVEFLRNKRFKRHFILGMNNGLDQQKIESISKKWSEERLLEWKRKNNFENRILILSSARIESKNGFEIMIKALPALQLEFPNILWCIIGSGSDENKIKKTAFDLRMENNVRFIGSIFDEEELAPYFLSTLIFIHPEAVGLSILHSFGYGIPIITHGRFELHGPEIAAFEDRVTGLAYEYRNIDSLSKTILYALRNKEFVKKMGANALRMVQEKYNIDIMVNRFKEIVNLSMLTDHI